MRLSKSTGRLTLRLPTMKVAFGRAWKEPRSLPLLMRGSSSGLRVRVLHFMYIGSTLNGTGLYARCQADGISRTTAPRSGLVNVGGVQSKSYRSVRSGAASRTVRTRTAVNCGERSSGYCAGRLRGRRAERGRGRVPGDRTCT
jgi:hypothetical protein